jgi:predicted small metal-binding protein
MAYVFYCREAGFDCNTMVDGETVEEILTKVGSHAAADHDISVTPVMADQVRTLIKSN